MMIHRVCLACITPSMVSAGAGARCPRCGEAFDYDDADESVPAPVNRGAGGGKHGDMALWALLSLAMILCGSIVFWSLAPTGGLDSNAGAPGFAPRLISAANAKERQSLRETYDAENPFSGSNDPLVIERWYWDTRSSGPTALGVVLSRDNIAIVDAVIRVNFYSASEGGLISRISGSVEPETIMPNEQAVFEIFGPPGADACVISERVLRGDGRMARVDMQIEHALQ